MDNLILQYNINIFEKVTDLLNSGKNIDEFNFKSDLHKIFEWFSCIKMMQEYKMPYYEYNDISPTFKEKNCMSRNDTGIDFSNLIDTIGQCKLRSNRLYLNELGTFVLNNVYKDNILKFRWNTMVVTRNAESKFSQNSLFKSDIFVDKTYSRKEILEYCKILIDNPPNYPELEHTHFSIRDYQKECIDLIKNMDNTKNLIISLPTGTGKNFIITHSLQSNVKYLILVPRIMLMEQIKDEIIKYHPTFKTKIQLIGDSNNEFKSEKDITICVFNSVSFVKEHIEQFDKIFVDEAHHINKPEIYIENDEEYIEDIDEEEYNDDENIDEEHIEENDIVQQDDIKEEDVLENENCDNNTYIKIIKSFQKYNNNIYLSATIDEHPKFNYYKKDIREMIDKGYLCDYVVKIPVFNDDPTNYNICKYLIDNYRSIIIYCNSQKEGDKINKLMNKIQNNCSEYIDCTTNRITRNEILNKYKSGKLPFLVNVKILVEGFDAPITKGVCFMHLPQSKNTLIQIIGRALRLYPNKTIANVILPFSSEKEEKTIVNFMRIIAKNDSRYLKSYQEKKIGGYISIDVIDDNLEIDEDNNICHKYDLIYKSLGTLQNNSEIWLKKLDELKEYIDKNNKRPSTEDKNINIKNLGIWLCCQQNFYKNKIRIMKNEQIYNIWTNFINDDKYKKYFLSYRDIWINTLNEVKEYIDKNNKRPSSTDKDQKVKSLGYWVSRQINIYMLKTKIMKDIYIYDIWTNLISDSKYKEYFLDRNTSWFNTFNEVKKYIDINGKRPSKQSKDIYTKSLGLWISNQTIKYKNKTEIMRNVDIYNEWTNLIDKYQKHFLSFEEIWLNIFEEVKKYINDNGKRPPPNSKDIKIKQLERWISSQLNKYKHKIEIMKNEYYYKLWTDFMNDYNKYFIKYLTNNNLM